MRPFHLIQITDCHLGSQPGEELLGLDTDRSLHDVMTLLQSQEKPDLLLATGDISNDGGVRSYERFIDFMKQYCPGVPMAWLPGNHDDPVNMDLVEEIPIEAHYMAGGWNFVFLDSKIPMEEGGELQQSELDRLDGELRRHRDVPTMVFLHHQVVPVGSAWVDEYLVKNHQAFFKVIDRYDHVKAVSWGHVHQEYHSSRKGVALIATPSTCVQFMPRHDAFRVDQAMPGYRAYKLYPDGRFTTKVHRVPHPSNPYPIDFDSKGY